MATNMEKIMTIITNYAPEFHAKFGIILGSGLASVAHEITDPINIPYQSLPGFQVSQVKGHPSMLVLGKFNGVPVACFKGRVHLYEGASYGTLKLMMYLLKHLGCQSVIITGAAGSLREEVWPGSIMLINDHINMQPGNPLVGVNDETIGPRFVNLENAYDANLRETMHQVSSKIGLPLSEGVYIATLGPVFETPAEIRAFRVLGADAVGMSVVPEVLLARYMGLSVLGIALITNLAVGLSKYAVSHELTLSKSDVLSRNLIKLLNAFMAVYQNQI